MDADLFSAIAVYALIVGAAFGLSYWAARAVRDRSANVGLYLLFGFPGLLLTIWGIAAAVSGTDNAATYLSVGLGLMLPLLKPFRKALSRVTPLDPASPIDMSGLCVLLAVGAAFAVILVNIGTSPDDLDVEAVNYAELFSTAAFEVALALVAVGWGIRRGFRAAWDRLGFTRPTPKVVLVALGFVVLAYIPSIAGSLLTQEFQPEIPEQIDSVTEDLTADVQNPVGAVALGFSAGVGEEAFFRGALQPRFGLVPQAVVFALVHSQYGLSFIVLGLFGVGIVLGIERHYFGTTAAVLTHAIFNIIAVLAAAAS